MRSFSERGSKAQRRGESSGRLANSTSTSAIVGSVPIVLSDGCQERERVRALRRCGRRSLRIFISGLGLTRIMVARVEDETVVAGGRHNLDSGLVGI